MRILLICIAFLWSVSIAESENLLPSERSGQCVDHRVTEFCNIFECNSALMSFNLHIQKKTGNPPGGSEAIKKFFPFNEEAGLSLLKVCPNQCCQNLEAEKFCGSEKIREQCTQQCGSSFNCDSYNECYEAYSQTACKVAAASNGYTVATKANIGKEFAGNYGTKGCYTYRKPSGYAGYVFYGLGGTKEKMKKQPGGLQFRPKGYEGAEMDCIVDWSDILCAFGDSDSCEGKFPADNWTEIVHEKGILKGHRF